MNEPKKFVLRIYEVEDFEDDIDGTSPDGFAYAVYPDIVTLAEDIAEHLDAPVQTFRPRKVVTPNSMFAHGLQSLRDDRDDDGDAA